MSHVGRLLLDGSDICNATLVAPSMILTAAHCVVEERRLAPVDPRRLMFLLEDPRDGQRRIFRAVSVGRRPDFSYLSREATNRALMEADIALVKLAGIAGRSGYEKIFIGELPIDEVMIPARLSPGRVPDRFRPCRSRQINARLLELSCDVPNGFSGSPVFVDTVEGRRLVAVISARARMPGQFSVYAARPAEIIPDIAWNGPAFPSEGRRLLRRAGAR